jgi:competence protein ComEC
MLEKPKLFLNLKEFWLILFLLSTLLLVRLFFLHESYSTFKSKPFYFTDVQVIQAYEKWNEDEYHTILKVYSPSLDLNFFSRTKIRASEITETIRLKLFPNHEMQFIEYLGTSFMHAQVKKIYADERTSKNSLLHLVEVQHTDPQIAGFYKAIFFATPLDKTLRRQVSSLGISHLIALSGFHLAILSTVLFFLIRLFYRPLQQRFFPYRFDLFDIGFMVLVLLLMYVWFVDAPPSLVRSFAMMLFAWILLIFGMELLSFTFLFTIVLIILVLFPKLLLSLAFWFSVAGVYYIFLLLHYFSTLNKFVVTLLISFGIFMLMLPIVHIIFPISSELQLLSPFISLLFSFFYPLSMLLHLIHLGGILDNALLHLFSLKSEEALLLIDFKYGVLYLFLSLLAIFSKWIFYSLLLVSFTFTVWLFSGFWV